MGGSAVSPLRIVTFPRDEVARSEAPRRRYWSVEATFAGVGATARGRYSTSGQSSGNVERNLSVEGLSLARFAAPNFSQPDIRRLVNGY